MRTALAALLCALSTVALADPIVGRATVIDGDTLDIRGQRFRLQGVDTPESAQLCKDATGKDYRCGQKASLALADKIGAGNVACEPIETDRYGRTVAVCSLGGLDLNGWLVEQGLGMAYRKYSPAYVRREEAAKAEKRGIWAGAFTPPWDWRKGERTGPEGRIDGAPKVTPTPVPAPKAASGECLIKGNINRKGDHIYHVPGSRDYERTMIDVSSGERMFCSTSDAEGAGWRAPRH